MSVQRATITEESPALKRAHRQAVDDVRCVAAGMHVLTYPLGPDEVNYLILKAERAKRSLSALADSLLLHSDPEFANTGYQEDVAEHCS